MANHLEYLIACVGAVAFAAGFPAGERRAGLVMAIALLANWLFVGWTYEPTSPHLLARAYGFPSQARDFWAVSDALFGGLVYAMGWSEQDQKPYWWSTALWYFAIMQLGLHVARQFCGMESAVYLWGLDKLLLAEVAIFICVGANGVSDWLSAGFDRLFLFGRAASAQALSRTRRE